MRKLRAFTLIELLIVVAIIAILAAIAVPNFLEAQVRSKVSRVRSDMRSLATGLESYYIDNNQYPAMTLTKADSPDSQFTQVNATNFARTFRIRNGNALGTLTTPVAYLTSYFPDAFADTKGSTFRYYTDVNGWILSSWGPDTDERTAGNLLMHKGDIIVNYENNTIESIYDSRIAQPSTALLTGQSTIAQNGISGAVNGAYTYDPTNGTVSNGDVYRVKQ